MGQFLNQKDNRTDLQRKLDERLRQKLAEQSKQESPGDTPDGVEDSAYIEGMKKTTSLAWAWMLVIFLALVALGVFIWRASTV